MLDHILPANVCDDREHRPGVRNIRQVLVGTDAQINAAGLHLFAQIADHVKIRSFIGNEVVRVEITFRLGPLLDVLSELLDRDLNVRSRSGRRLFLSPPCCRSGERQDEEEGGTKYGRSTELKPRQHDCDHYNSGNRIFEIANWRLQYAL